MSLRNFYNSLVRKKSMAVGETELNKFLSTFDLTVLGIGSTLGVGVYILSGDVSKNYTGPAIVISFAIAAFASLLAGLCYAEFGARVPKAGSAYVYCFVTIGEFIAFIIGWNLILEYAIGSASVAKGISNYLNAITGNVISEKLRELFPIDISFFGNYADFLAFGIIFVLTLGLAFGARESTAVNNVFTMVNVSVVVFVIVCGSLNMNFDNWSIQTERVPKDYGNGGFLPYGIMGVIKGAGICFYAFIGFDVIATAGEEAENPRRSIPFSICISLFIIFLSYLGISSALTLMVPYFDQDVNAPLASAFNTIGWKAAQYVVTFGAIFGMFSSLFGSMFPLPRIIYAIAEDGLIFGVFSKVHQRFRTPFWGTLIAGLLTGLLAMLFNLDQLVNMMSIGTIMAYSIVAACVMLLRYDVDDFDGDELILSGFEDPEISMFSRIFNRMKLTEPTKFSSNLVTLLVAVYSILCTCMSLTISNMGNKLLEGDEIWIGILAASICGIIVVLTIISQQPSSSKELSFKAPLNPWFPALSIMINIHLMVELDKATWIRFVIWVGIGLVIYFAYSRRHSKLKSRDDEILND